MFRGVAVLHRQPYVRNAGPGVAYDGDHAAPAAPFDKFQRHFPSFRMYDNIPHNFGDRGGECLSRRFG